MPNLIRTASLTWVIFALTPILCAQTPVKWETSLDAALARAQEAGKPLLISMHTSSEIACKRMLENLYTDPEVVAILSEFILLPTCFDLHDEVKRMVDGKEKMVSPLFGTIGCKQLQRNEQQVRERFFEKPDVKVPQHLFVGDDGKVYFKKIYELKKAKFIKLLNNALILYGSKASDGMDKVTQGFLKTVKKGPMKEKRHGVKGVLGMEDQRKLDILYLTIQSIKKDKEKGECVRAFGKDSFTWASPTVIKWLRDPSVVVRNCAVVSLEEMKADGAAQKLVDMFRKERDKELRKDLLRALGPCGEGRDDVKKILMKNAAAKREDDRIGAYLSLGYYLEQEDVQELLARRWKREGKSVAAKTAILWAYTFRKSLDLIPQMRGLVAKEKNHQLKYIADAAERTIRTGSGVDPKEGRAGYIKLHNAMGIILGKDKFMRNRHKYWRDDD